MSVPRSRTQEIAYKKFLKAAGPDTCLICVIEPGNDQLVTETAHFKVIKNAFPYSVWDSLAVTDHLMISPKTHTDSIANMTDDQKIEYVNLLEKYEKIGYNIYARAPGSVVKSLFHQHTHLIKTTGQPKWFTLAILKPLIRITF